MHVLGEQVDGLDEHIDAEVLAHVVDEIGESGVGERTERFVGGPAATEQQVLVEELVHGGDEFCGGWYRKWMELVKEMNTTWTEKSLHFGLRERPSNANKCTLKVPSVTSLYYKI